MHIWDFKQTFLVVCKSDTNLMCDLFWLKCTTFGEYCGYWISSNQTLYPHSITKGNMAQCIIFLPCWLPNLYIRLYIFSQTQCCAGWLLPSIFHVAAFLFSFACISIVILSCALLTSPLYFLTLMIISIIINYTSSHLCSFLINELTTFLLPLQSIDWDFFGTWFLL